MVGVIAGATATGKSAVAIDVARELGGTIINADASQVYADLRILSARPSDADMAAVPHRLYGCVDGANACSAADWAFLARAEIDVALEAGRVPLLVGGTGLYLRTLLDGIAPVPEIDADVRAKVRSLDPDAANAALEREDPAAAARLERADRQRTLRALEVVRSTGRTLADWQGERTGGIAATHAVVAIVVERDRAELRDRCSARVGAMLAAGALDEVAALVRRNLDTDSPIMRAIGVPQLSAVLDNSMTLAAAESAIIHATRRYAKRQATWFRNQTPDWHRYEPGLTNLNGKVSDFFTA